MDPFGLSSVWFNRYHGQGLIADRKAGCSSIVGLNSDVVLSPIYAELSKCKLLKPCRGKTGNLMNF